MTARTTSSSALLTLGLDVVLVIVFATIGRASHERGLTLPGILETAWPFLAALGVGWLALRAWRAPSAVVGTGIPLWIITVAVGMLLRAITGTGIALPFVIVATLTLLLLLVGSRGIMALVRRRAAPAN